MGKQFW